MTIRSLNQSTGPLIEEVTRTVVTTNEQLEKVDDITSNVSDASANVSALSSLVTSTVGQPLIKVASFSYGVRQAFRGGKSGDAHGTGNTHAGGQYGSAQGGSYSAGGEN